MKFVSIRKISLFFEAFIRSGSDAQDPKYRLGVGILLVNQEGKIFVGKRGRYSEWGMPQGGVDFHHKKQESFSDAAWRELWEEVGIKTHCQIIAHTNRSYRYEFPAFSLWRLRFKGQKQIWYGFMFSGDDTDINLNVTIYPEFTSWKWIKKEELITHCPSFKRALYTSVLEELWPLILKKLP